MLPVLLVVLRRPQTLIRSTAWVRPAQTGTRASATRTAASTRLAPRPNREDCRTAATSPGASEIRVRAGKKALRAKGGGSHVAAASGAVLTEQVGIFAIPSGSAAENLKHRCYQAVFCRSLGPLLALRCQTAFRHSQLKGAVIVDEQRQLDVLVSSDIWKAMFEFIEAFGR